MSEVQAWVEVRGTVTKTATGYHVEAEQGGGSFEIGIDECRGDENGLSIAVGSTAKNVTFASTSDDSQKDMELMRDTYCIAFALFRCRDNALIGSCIGAWDCG